MAHSLCLGESFFRALLSGNVCSYCNILIRFLLFIQNGHYGGVYPVKGTIFSAIFNIAVPHLATGNRCPQRYEECPVMIAGAHNSMVLSEQFVTIKAADLTKFIVNINDVTAFIRNTHNGMFIECFFL